MKNVCSITSNRLSNIGNYIIKASPCTLFTLCKERIFYDTFLAAGRSELPSIPMLNVCIVQSKSNSLAHFTVRAVTRLESRPPDKRHPIRLSDIIRLRTLFVSRLRMLAFSSSSSLQHKRCFDVHHIQLQFWLVLIWLLLIRLLPQDLANN